MNKIGLERISKIDQHLSMADAMLRAMCGDPETYKLSRVAEIKVRQAREYTANAMGRVAETYSFFHGDPITALEEEKICSQCGKVFSESACGFTHAALALEKD